MEYHAGAGLGRFLYRATASERTSRVAKRAFRRENIVVICQVVIRCAST